MRVYERMCICMCDNSDLDDATTGDVTPTDLISRWIMQRKTGRETAEGGMQRTRTGKVLLTCLDSSLRGADSEGRSRQSVLGENR